MVALIQESAITGFVTKAKAYGDHRILVLVDERAPGRIAVGLITHPFDQSVSGNIADIFDRSLEVLHRTPADVILSASELPILHAIGRYRVTIVRRTGVNQVTITDGENTPVGDYLGLG